MADTPASRIPDSHKSAFWIYGVTAMVMREPLAVVTRDVSTRGVGDPAVQMECLRMMVTLLLLSRQFLAAGVYFDRVYLAPDSSVKYPRRNYPLDFLTRLVDMLTVVAASSTVAAVNHLASGLTPFLVLTGGMLLLDGAWLAVAKVANYSSVIELSAPARNSLLVLAVCAGIYGASLAGGVNVWTMEALILAIVLLYAVHQLAAQIRSYGRA